MLTQYNPSFFIRGSDKSIQKRRNSFHCAASCGILWSNYYIEDESYSNGRCRLDIVIFDKFGSQIPFPLEVDLPCKGALNGRYSYVTNDFFIMCTDLVYTFCVSSKY